MIIRRLMLPLTLALMIGQADRAGAQSAFPAPLPGHVQQNDPAFPPVNGAAPSASMGGASSGAFSSGAAPITGAAFGGAPAPPPPQAAGGGPSDQCMKGFMPLREDAEKRGKLIKAASDRHAPPDEACKLISSFGQAEVKMIKYVEANATKCGIPAQIGDQLKAGHKNTDALEKKVCSVAQQMQQRGPAGPSLSDVLGSAAAVPQATASKKPGGSTFDTLNGNVLAR